VQLRAFNELREQSKETRVTRTKDDWRVQIRVQILKVPTRRFAVIECDIRMRGQRLHELSVDNISVSAVWTRDMAANHNVIATRLIIAARNQYARIAWGPWRNATRCVLVVHVRLSFRVNVSCNYNAIAKRTSNKAWDSHYVLSDERLYWSCCSHDRWTGLGR